MDIGFVGLGNMGSAIARNLIAAGHKVTVWNRSPDKAAAVVAAGAILADDPAGAARGDLVLTMLADDTAVEAVVFGAGGILSAKTSILHVSLSTISITLAERLTAAHAEAGGSYVSAPVFGRPEAAAAAKLFVASAGPPEALATCAPVFAAISQRAFDLGPVPASANVVKLSGNFMILAAIEAMAEAMAFGEKNGVPRAKLLEVLTGTLFDAPLYRNYGAMLAEERFKPAGFAAPLGLKDMGLVAAAAAKARVPMPVLGVVRDHLLSAIAVDGEDVDWSGIGAAVFRNAGI